LNNFLDDYLMDDFLNDYQNVYLDDFLKKCSFCWKIKDNIFLKVGYNWY